MRLQFQRNESGSVTVDWVVLTAAIVVVATAIVLSIRGSLDDAANRISNEVNGIGGSDSGSGESAGGSNEGEGENQDSCEAGGGRWEPFPEPGWCDYAPQPT